MTKTKLEKKQLEYFKKKLEKLKENILHDMKNMNGMTGIDGAKSGADAPAGHGLHMADVATDMYDREFNLGLASNERELLQRVDAALKRIEDGTYGICLKSKKSIPQARLKAIPYAEYTVAAQEELEQNSR